MLELEDPASIGDPACVSDPAAICSMDYGVRYLALQCTEMYDNESTTRKLCCRKDDRTMRPIYGQAPGPPLTEGPHQTLYILFLVQSTLIVAYIRLMRY